jgi:Glycosyltransferase 61
MGTAQASDSGTRGLRYFVPIFGNYYHFMTESALGLYRLLVENGCTESKDCRIWYQGGYGGIVQMFSKYPITSVRIQKPYIQNGAELDGSIKTLQHIRIFRHPTGRADLLLLRDFLARQIPHSPAQKGILVVKRNMKRCYREHEECIKELAEYRLPVWTVALETLSFGEQVNIMRNTKILVAPHGAGTVNMIFMEPGSKVIELFPKGIANWHAAAIAKICGHQLIEIESEEEGPFHREPPDGVRKWIAENGWPTRELGQQWRDMHKDIERAVRDVAEFSVPVRRVIEAIDTMGID